MAKVCEASICHRSQGEEELVLARKAKSDPVPTWTKQQSIEFQAPTGDAIVPENRVNCDWKGKGESDLNRHERVDAIGEISHGSHDIDVAGERGPADVSTSSNSHLR
jgi:hypothetical protein